MQGRHADVLLLDNDGPQQAGFGFDELIYSLIPLPDGRVLVSGNFRRVHGEANPGFVRLRANGTIDPTFRASWIPFFSPITAARLPDGSLVFVGIPSAFSTNNSARLVKLDANGALVPTFHPDLEAKFAKTIAQPDGKILISGDFISVNGQPRNGFARLLPSGALDTTFNVGDLGASQAIVNIRPLNSGKILVYCKTDFRRYLQRRMLLFLWLC